MFCHPAALRAVPGLTLSICTAEVSGAAERTGGWLPHTTHPGNNDTGINEEQNSSHEGKMRLSLSYSQKETQKPRFPSVPIITVDSPLMLFTGQECWNNEKHLFQELLFITRIWLKACRQFDGDIVNVCLLLDLTLMRFCIVRMVGITSWIFSLHVFAQWKLFYAHVVLLFSIILSSVSAFLLFWLIV